MAETKRTTAEEVVGYLLEGEGLDFLRESLSWVVQQLMEAEVSELVGAARGERAPEERLTHRNGYRTRAWATRARELELAIPKLRRGSYFPSFLEPRRRSEQALVSVVQEAYVAGVSTRVAWAADLEERGVADLPGPRRAGRRVPQPAARGPLPVPLARAAGDFGDAVDLAVIRHQKAIRFSFGVCPALSVIAKYAVDGGGSVVAQTLPLLPVVLLGEAEGG